MANINIGGRLHSTATGNTVAGANEVLDDVKGKKQDVINAEVDEALAGKQATIEDLSTIRSGAAAGATAYQKPGTGIPASDTAAAVQTSLGKADTAYQKPSGGIPKSDTDSGVQTSLGKADTALQWTPVGSITPPATPSDWATAEELSQLEHEVHQLAGKFYGVFADDSDLPDDADAVGYAFVGTTNPFAVWNFDGTNWSNSGTEVTGITGEPGVGFQSIYTPSPYDGTVIIVLTDGNTITVDLNHDHLAYPKYHLCADEAEYTGITTKDSTTLYLIPES